MRTVNLVKKAAVKKISIDKFGRQRIELYGEGVVISSRPTVIASLRGTVMLPPEVDTASLEIADAVLSDSLSFLETIDGLLTLKGACALDLRKTIAITGEDYISVYPNPASDYLTIKIRRGGEGFYNLLILNEIGEKVFVKSWIETYKFNRYETLKLDLSDFARGVYYVRYLTPRKTFDLTFVVE